MVSAAVDAYEPAGGVRDRRCRPTCRAGHHRGPDRRGRGPGRRAPPCRRRERPACRIVDGETRPQAGQPRQSGRAATSARSTARNICRMTTANRSMTRDGVGRCQAPGALRRAGCGMSPGQSRAAGLSSGWPHTSFTPPKAPLTCTNARSARPNDGPARSGEPHGGHLTDVGPRRPAYGCGCRGPHGADRRPEETGQDSLLPAEARRRPKTWGSAAALTARWRDVDTVGRPRPFGRRHMVSRSCRNREPGLRNLRHPVERGDRHAREQ